MQNRKFSPGFRISITDALVLLAGAFGSVWLGTENWQTGFIIGFVVGHFFLFCNVFRISRKPELIWASLFTSLTTLTLLTGFPPWPLNIGVTLLITTVLIVREMRLPHYHGVFWSRINPDLRLWWERAEGQSRPR